MAKQPAKKKAPVKKPVPKKAPPAKKPKPKVTAPAVNEYGFRTTPIRRMERKVNGQVRLPIGGLYPAIRFQIKGRKGKEAFTIAFVTA